jgi:hypothetical protein
MAGTDGCPDHCLSKTNLQSCPAECECNYVREIIQIIKAWDKKNNKDTESLDIKSENYYDE